MTYRSDHDAALARISSLELELREARREIDRQRGHVPAAGIELPVVAAEPHVYDDSWTSTSTEADRQLREALRDAKAYRREQDANPARAPRIESAKRAARSSSERRFPEPNDAHAAAHPEGRMNEAIMSIALVTLLFFAVLLMAFYQVS